MSWLSLTLRTGLVVLVVCWCGRCASTAIISTRRNFISVQVYCHVRCMDGKDLDLLIALKSRTPHSVPAQKVWSAP